MKSPVRDDARVAPAIHRWGDDQEICASPVGTAEDASAVPTGLDSLRPAFVPSHQRLGYSQMSLTEQMMKLIIQTAS
jgi:hypothetical protein